MMTIPPVSNERNFFEISKEIARSFLQSVVVIDDQATFAESKPEKPAANLQSPTEYGRRHTPEADIVELEDNNTVEGDKEVLVETIEESARPEENLYVKALNDCFAEIGLVCGVLKPTETELTSLAEKADHIARRADIVVFDWLLSKDEKPGATALQSIYAILRADEDDSGNSVPQSRMRLIAIYTSELNLDGIVNSVNSFLNENEIIFSKNEDYPFTLFKEGAKIVFYRKDRGLKPSLEVQSRTINESELVCRLIDDFTEMTYGLLSNIALDSLGALRNNTHRILGKFGRNLDAPYLTHRAMLAPEDEARQHPVPLLASEFNDVLEDCEVDRNASIEAIGKWLDYKLINNEISKEEEISEIENDEYKLVLLDLIEKGKNSTLDEFSSDGKRNNKIKTYRDKIKKLLKNGKNSTFTTTLSNESEGAIWDLEFSILTTIRSQYKKPEPILSLGVIICKIVSGVEHYFVCIQPPCDSVRLEGDTIFPFLQLQNSELPDKKGKIEPEFELVVKDNETYKKFRINLKPSSIFLFNLSNRDAKEIRAIKDTAGEFIFETVGDEMDLRWIATLKFAHAQRIANDFAREISRVGLTESEWLRKMGS